MELLHFPNELLETVAEYVLPEGFESLALTCKRMHAVCAPFIEYHNRLRRQFQDFYYYKTNPSQLVKSNPALLLLPDTISSAFNLIGRIAMEPVVARYIQHADFNHDSRITKGLSRQYATDNSREEAVMKMLADSSDLKQAGLDWKEYYAAIEEDLNAARYSQHAAAFALTLLPHLKTLQLPRWWKPQTAPDKLIDIIISKARNAPGSGSSLAAVTSLVGNGCAENRFDLDWARPLLALPNVQSFGGYICKGTGGSYGNAPFEYAALENISLIDASIDEAAIASVLQCTPNLKTFRCLYARAEDSDPQQGWDLCQFLLAIEQNVGNHLIDLSLLVDAEDHVSITPGKVSICGFQRLQRLELPFKIAVCNLTAVTPTSPESLISDIIPASVSQLSFVSHGTSDEAKALEVMFHDFFAKKSQLPALQEIHLTLPMEATDSYKEHFVTVSAEIERAGVKLVEEPFIQSATWEDDENE
ncbi:F-box domain protein [Penicillium canariense]|uniref:F-box domain protein n=1 Tax=Penicillium canariense TaxID=189055 RepID=A0A9W9I5C2_9EURO|nr:F-box domain protein [Penicillium canariense]KAJ5168165.1 F-box domain protein [Penicillium canariense]